MARAFAEQQQLLKAALADQSELATTLELVWRQACASMPPGRLAEWVDRCREMAARLGPDAAIVYIRNSPAVASSAGAGAALALGEAAAAIAALAGPQAARALFVAAPHAARRLGSSEGFADWLRIVRLIAERAPESALPLLERMAILLDRLGLRAFETWSLGGIRAAENDPERRRRFFALLDIDALRFLGHSGDAIAFTEVEREIKAFITALWRRAPPIRVEPPEGFDAPQRVSFGNGLVRVPQSFRGFAGSGAAIYRAALAHVTAHLQFTPAKFPVGSLKPVQIALISLIEDARVEWLALAELPGLKRLWLPFHFAEPTSALTAPALMARLARALLDPDYVDPHQWVAKGRGLFFADPAQWHDPAMSRRIGGILGNDLGQMRAQFSFRTYVVEPAYRDDNRGLWDFPDAAPSAGETIYEAARFAQTEDQQTDREEPGERDREAATPARSVTEEAEIGIPVARYSEWDFLIARERPDWTTLVEYVPPEGRVETIDRALERYPETAHRIAALVRAAKVSRPVRLRRQSEGDRLDLEAAIAAAIDRFAGLAPSANVYARLERRWRDLTVLVLIDVSQSTNDIVRAADRSVLELERDATVLLAEAMNGLGDPFAIHAFSSDTRDDVRYFRLKEFAMPWDAAAKRRLAGITGQFSTRMGAALRHAGRELQSCSSYRKLLLVISDGEPSDVDIADRRYLIEDARRAVMAVRHGGIDVFCVGLDAGGDSYLTRIFGRHFAIQLDRVERLPEKLPLLYFRLS